VHQAGIEGLANVGVTDPETIIAQARGLLERGISTSTFGVEIGFNEDLLVSTARAGGGNHEFIEGAEDFERIFAREMEGLVREVCAQVGLRIEPAPGVTILDMMNDFEERLDGSFNLPSLIAGEPLDVLIRVLLPGKGLPSSGISASPMRLRKMSTNKAQTWKWKKPLPSWRVPA
jgi:Ca-activated chloride channel homolog